MWQGTSKGIHALSTVDLVCDVTKVVIWIAMSVRWYKRVGYSSPE